MLDSGAFVEHIESDTGQGELCVLYGSGKCAKINRGGVMGKKMKTLELNPCVVCKIRPKLERVETLEGAEGRPEKLYVVRCHGFAHRVLVHHRGKANVIRLWNTINPGEKMAAAGRQTKESSDLPVMKREEESQ
jgi:hypothetical protein